jgi:hypothetical protein
MRIEEVKTLLKDNSPFKISKPQVTRTFFGGGIAEEGLVIAKLWMDGVEIEAKHLPVLARIIYVSKQKKMVPASQIALGHTKLVIEAALKYQHILEKYDLNITFKTGGKSFEAK